MCNMSIYIDLKTKLKKRHLNDCIVNDKLKMGETYLKNDLKLLVVWMHF